MKVLVKDRSISTSKGIFRNGDEIDLPDAEVKKIMVMKPSAFEILKAEPKPAKKATAKKKRARNEDGTLKADDPSTPENEAWEDA
tara:strand:- start:881 stop:1135 length:255 start_codon:yes stop_codon:yes gene_type:complete